MYTQKTSLHNKCKSLADTQQSWAASKQRLRGISSIFVVKICERFEGEMEEFSTNRHFCIHARALVCFASNPVSRFREKDQKVIMRLQTYFGDNCRHNSQTGGF